MIRATLKTFWTNQSGATAVEYTILASMIALAIVVAVAALGQSLKVPFQQAEAGFTAK